MRKPTEQLWTVEQVAEFCQVKPSVVRYWIQQRQIPFLRLGKFVRFDPMEVRGWVGKRKHGVGSLDYARQLKEIM